MGATSSITVSSKVNGSGSFSGTITDVGATDIEIPQTAIPASTSNYAFTMAFTLANVQAYMFLADQNCVLTTNSTGSPSDTINLKAGIPFFWSRSGYAAVGFSANVTSIYVTTTNGTIFQARVVTN